MLHYQRDPSDTDRILCIANNKLVGQIRRVVLTEEEAKLANLIGIYNETFIVELFEYTQNLVNTLDTAKEILSIAYTLHYANYNKKN